MSKFIKTIPLLLLPIAMSAQAKNYYLATSSAGSADCSSWDNRCTGLSSALGKTKAGDTLHIANGLYVVNSMVNIVDPITVIGGYAAHAEEGYGSTVISGDSGGDDTSMSEDGELKGVVETVNDLSVMRDDVQGIHILNLKNSAPVTIRNLVLTGFNAEDGCTTSCNGVAMEIENSFVKLDNIRFQGNREGNAGVLHLENAAQVEGTSLRFINNAANNGGAISFYNGAGIDFSCKYCEFIGNKAGVDGGALWTVTGNSPDKITFESTQFIENTAAGKAGALYLEGASVVNLESVLFKGNKSGMNKNAGAINVVHALMNIESATFIGNEAQGSGKGGAINYGGTTAPQKIAYSTFYNNDAGVGGAIHISVAATKMLTLQSSIILGNTADTDGSGPNITSVENVIDGGFNLIGIAGASGLSDSSSMVVDVSALVNHSTSFTPGVESKIEDVIELNLVNNGGELDSLKIPVTSIAKDYIANDGIPFYGVGQSEAWPFTTLQQANAALRSYDNYEAKIYFFDLEKEYTKVDGTYELNKLNGYTGNGKFSSYVDKDGWVLLASGNHNNSTVAVLAATNNLDQDRDEILLETIVTNPRFDFTQVRVATKPDSPKSLDIRSSNSNVVAAVKAYNMLPNNFAGDPIYGKGGWAAYAGNKHIANPTCSAANYDTTGTAYKLDEVVYDACGNPNALSWKPNQASVSTETHDLSGGTHTVDFNLWVRFEGVCDGSVSMDGRGLPRSDWVNPSDSNQDGDIRACDIGAFEYNEGYRFDCYAEDGMRPENKPLIDLASGTLNFNAVQCLGGDLSKATPGALLDSLGSIQLHLLMFISLFGLYRLRLNG